MFFAGLFAKMFASDKAIESTVNAVSKGLDALVYTDEEKAGDAAKERTQARQMIVQWMQSTQGQNLARRFIAIVVTGIWASQYLLIQILSVAAVWVDAPEKLLDSAKVIGNYSDQATSAMMLVLGFYFAAPYMGSIVDKALSRFGNKKQD